MSTNKEKISKLVFKRRVPLERLREIFEYGVNSTAEAYFIQNFLTRAEFANSIYEEFQNYHTQIISLVTEEAEFNTQDEERKLADKYFYGIKDKRTEISLSDIGNSRPGPSQLNSSISSGAKLPKISVPIFDGNLKTWPAFFDLFRSLVHENISLSKIEKYHFLMTSLKGEPFNLIKAIQMTEDNYQIAYDTLLGRYQNKRVLATNYFNEIYSAPNLQKSSSKDLRLLLDTFSENLASLKVLKFDTDRWDFLIFNMLLQKLDTKTRTDFELEYSNIEMPTYNNLFSFLESQCKALEAVRYTMPSSYNKLKPNFSNSTASQPSSNKKWNMPSACLNMVDAHQRKINLSCVLCSSAHALYRCQSFLSKTPHDRLAVVRQNNLCTNCMRSRHSVRQCPTSTNCKICQLPHHTLLHLNKNNNSSTSSVRDRVSSHSGPTLQIATSENSTAPHMDQPVEPLQCSTSLAPFTQSTVLLSTVEVEIRDGRGHFQKIRGLFDCGSMSNFISEKCVNRLGLSRRKFSIPIEGLNNTISTSNRGISQCFIKPQGKNNPTFTFDAIILPKVCSPQPKVAINTEKWLHIRNLSLADRNFHSPGPIDILFGAELVPFMLGSGRIFGEAGQPVAIETVFGWMLQGKTTCTSQSIPLSSCHSSIEPQIELSLQKFWEIEQIPTSNNLSSPEDMKCEAIYKQTVHRNDSGNFVVSLPFRQAEPDFGDTYTQAFRRFLSLESRLVRNPKLHALYSDVLKEYIHKNYISEVSKSDFRSASAFYLPHRCVLKPDSTSTKLRIVFDASAKGEKGISLNDTLFPGPKLQQDLSVILLKFRTPAIAFICDIKQMYCQILVTPEHRKFQRFLWRFNPNQDITEYTLNRVVFGVSSAPYLALRTLKELALLEQDNHPQASKVLQESVYMDDCVSGADTLELALFLQSELITLLKKGGFELQKWASNHPAILSAIPNAGTKPLSFSTEGHNLIKVLGLQWDPNLDAFSYSCTPIECTCTKRNILSQVARIFDPLGFLSPIVFLAKRIIQQLWLSKVGWDDAPPASIVQVWNNFKLQLPEISKIQLPRLLTSQPFSRLELHGFCDGSSFGYSCVIYFRFITTSGETKTTLISGKSKVAPLKVISLPRIELCAAYLLARLIKFVKQSYADRLTFDSIYAWSDSQVALAWLSSSPHRWKTFVANRVSHIQEIIPPSSWRYVPTGQNPADCSTRGLTPSQLLEHKLWWNGPHFLLQNPRTWPEQPSILLDNLTDASREEKHLNLHVSIETPSFICVLLSKYSSLKKIQRILAYVLRFLSVLKKTAKYTTDILSPSENFLAFQLIVKEVQKQCFSDIILACQKNMSLPKPLRKLAPFLDEAGVLRVGGRLKNSSLSFDAKHPILLPKVHRFTDLIIEQVHQENFHPGLKTLHNLLLQSFWIISPRSAIYRCLSKCLKCFRSKPRAYAPFMGDLPAFRVSQIKAFSQVAVDYAGPFKVTMGKHRGVKTTKAYFCIFVCCATKACHLELSSDLSTEAFLASFRRFIARRGRVSDIYSDQGSNFIGANNQLLAFAKAAATKLSINWHFSPPASPHFNGLVEAGVKSVKTHILRIVGEQILTYEEFYTLLTQIEALLNSRPLSAISEDPNDCTPLTPGHFLTMEPLSSFPEPDISHVSLGRLNRWQMLQRMHSDFWKRWSQEYLHTLQQRGKWMTNPPNIKLNTLVLIKNELRPPLEWALGRVIRLHPGADGIVRVVTLKTKTGTLQRPVVKLCPLPGQ